MKLSSLVTRVAAASAVVGLALIGPAVAAGASSLPVSLPVSVGHVVSGPVVNVVPSPASPVASGADATVPAHGDASVATPVTGAGPRVAKSSASLDACVATALLTDHDVAGCGSTAGNNGAASAPSLADLLSRVGACARIALEQGQSTNVCAASDSGAAAGSGSGVPPFNSAAVGDVVADNGLCDAASLLGLDFDACSVTSAATGGLSDGSGPAAATRAADNRVVEVCHGLAVVADLDPATCTVKTDAKSSGPRGKARVNVAATSEGGTSIAAPAQLNANCASSNASVGTSPFRNPAMAGLGTIGALGGLGMALRRLRRPRLG
jgi:hypothetical protein